jgi:hypothetical protein
MSRAIRSLSSGLLSCPVCEVHHEFSLGKLAQHIREHHQQHIYTSSQHDSMQQLGLKSCPTCHLYYSEHSSGFNRHIEQCQANAPAVSRRKRARSPDPSESAAKRGRHEQPVYAFPYHPDRHLDEEVLLEQKENEGPIEEKEAQEPQVAVSLTDHTDSVTPTDIANHPKLLRKIP